jgi:iron complex transport system ATP-binding protein
MSKVIIAEELGFTYSRESGNTFELRGIDIEIKEGSFVSVIGRNGSGKSTLIKLLAKQFGKYKGTIFLDGKNIADYENREFARKLAYLPQNVSVVNEGIQVIDLIMLGRYPAKGTFEFVNTSEDRKIVNECIEQLGIGEIAYKKFGEISGGQRQKVLIALTLAQLDISSDLHGKVFVVDEPLTFLDVNHQYEVFNLLKTFNKRGLTVISVIHDLNFALKFTDSCMLMNSGSVVSFDNTGDVITEEMLREHFLIESRITEFEKNFFINYLT